MQETQHNVTGEMRQEFFAAATNKKLKKQMDSRLEELPDETLVRRVKVGRNQKCPCGSGRKFKRCCLSKTLRY